MLRSPHPRLGLTASSLHRCLSPSRPPPLPPCWPPAPPLLKPRPPRLPGQSRQPSVVRTRASWSHSCFIPAPDPVPAAEWAFRRLQSSGCTDKGRACKMWRVCVWGGGEVPFTPPHGQLLAHRVGPRSLHTRISRVALPARSMPQPPTNQLPHEEAGGGSHGHRMPPRQQHPHPPPGPQRPRPAIGTGLSSVPPDSMSTRPCERDLSGDSPCRGNPGRPERGGPSVHRVTG